LLRFLLERAAEEHRTFVDEGSDVIVNAYVDYYNADCSLLPGSASAAYRRELMAGVVAGIVASARDARVPVLFLFVPHPIDVCRDYDLGQVDPHEFAEYRRSNLTDTLVAIAQGLGAAHVDLFPILWAVDANDYYFREGDDHWNDAGQDLAAGHVAEFVKVHGLLPGRPR
jgi:hypothetical protein